MGIILESSVLLSNSNHPTPHEVTWLTSQLWRIGGLRQALPNDSLESEF